jgi:hypothetical protein
MPYSFFGRVKRFPESRAINWIAFRPEYAFMNSAPMDVHQAPTN